MCKRFITCYTQRDKTSWTHSIFIIWFKGRWYRMCGAAPSVCRLSCRHPPGRRWWRRRVRRRWTPAPRTLTKQKVYIFFRFFLFSLSLTLSLSISFSISLSLFGGNGGEGSEGGETHLLTLKVSKLSLKILFSFFSFFFLSPHILFLAVNPGVGPDKPDIVVIICILWCRGWVQTVGHCILINYLAWL